MKILSFQFVHILLISKVQGVFSEHACSLSNNSEQFSACFCLFYWVSYPFNQYMQLLVFRYVLVVFYLLDRYWNPTCQCRCLT